MGHFDFKQFSIDDDGCAMKLGTDAVLLGAWAAVDGAAEVVDAGCGSGVLSLMVAQRCPGVERIIAVDISHEACRDAARNVAASPWSDRVEVMEADITKDFPQTGHPLLVISNPPFFSEALRSPDSARALARHGEDFGVEALIGLAAGYFTSAADSLAFIAPTSRTDEIDFMLSLKRLSPRRICRVFSRMGRESIRTLWQVGLEVPEAPRLQREELYIRDTSNNLTAQYQSLTSGFYLDK